MLMEIECFVNWVRRRNPQARTWRDYRADLKQFVAVVGDRPPQAITFHDVDRFVAQQTARGLQPGTVNRRLAAITSFTLSWPTTTRSWSAPCCPTATASKNASACPAPFRKRSFAGSLPPWTTGGTERCSC